MVIFATLLGIFILVCVAYAYFQKSPDTSDDENEVAEKKTPTYRSSADWYLDPVHYMNPQHWNLAGTTEMFENDTTGVTVSDNSFGYCESTPTIIKTDAAGTNCPTPDCTTPPPATPPPDTPPTPPPDTPPTPPPDSTPPPATPPPTSPPATEKDINYLTTLLTDWMLKNAPKPEQSPYEAAAQTSPQTPYGSAHDPPASPLHPPSNNYRGEYPKDEPVQTAASDMKPGMSSYNTSTVFIPPPIGGGFQKNTAPEPAACPACARCPEPSFDCKKVPNYSSTNSEYLPMPVLSDFSTFGM